MNKKQHPFAEVLHAIAEGEEVQCQSYYDDMWYTIDAHTILAEICSGREISPTCPIQNQTAHNPYWYI